MKDVCSICFTSTVMLVNHDDGIESFMICVTCLDDLYPDPVDEE